jgi:hypothetical protein
MTNLLDRIIDAQPWRFEILDQALERASSVAG